MMPPSRPSRTWRSTPLGAAEADVEDVDARVREASDQRLGQLGAREADVAPDRHALRLQPLGIGPADRVGGFLVEFLGNASADVVGLEAI
jgi:hypothetical protein